MTTSKEPISYLIIAEGQELELKLFESLFEKMLPGCRAEKFVNGVPAGYESILSRENGMSVSCGSYW